MTEKIELDDLDRKILSILQKDATCSVQEIADAVGLSSNPCWRRIKNLESSGVIEKRVAIVDPAKLGLRTVAFVMVRTSQHDKAWLKKFADGIQKIPEIVECHRMSGDIDYLLKILVRDIQHYDAVYQNLISKVPGLSDVSSAFSMEGLKKNTAVSLNVAEYR